MRNIAIVYGVYINATANWRKLVGLQLKDLSASGVLLVSDLHIIVTNASRTEGVAEFFESLPIPIKKIEFHDKNAFEYPAIAYLWNLASSRADYEYIAYLHTKGMSYASEDRDAAEATLTRFTFYDWPKALRVFKFRSHIQKIGMLPSELGWIWINFWWARSSYLRSLQKPQITGNRFYWESWLGYSSPNPDGKDCYSLWSNSEANFSHADALKIIDALPKKYRRHKRIHHKLYRLVLQSRNRILARFMVATGVR